MFTMRCAIWPRTANLCGSSLRGRVACVKGCSAEYLTPLALSLCLYLQCARRDNLAGKIATLWMGRSMEQHLLEEVLATVQTPALQSEGMDEAANLVLTHPAQAEETGYDNWNGGTEIWEVRFQIPATEFARLGAKRNQLEEQITPRLESCLSRILTTGIRPSSSRQRKREKTGERSVLVCRNESEQTLLMACASRIWLGTGSWMKSIFEPFI